MKESLEKICDDFLSAQKTIASVQPLLTMFAYPICAELFVEKGVKPDKRTLKKCDKLLIKKAGLFNEFSGLCAMLTISILSLSVNPKEKYDQIERARALIKQNFKVLPDHAVLASLVLAEDIDEDTWQETVEKATAIYNALNVKGRILTNGSDLVLSLLLAKTDKDVEKIISDAEKCKGELQKYKFSATSTKALSRILAINTGSSHYKCDRFEKLYSTLLDHGIKYGQDYQLPMLGLASLIPESVEDIARDIVAIDAYLATKDPYAGLAPKYSSKVRLMHAAMLLVGAYNLNSESADNPDDKLNYDIYIAMELGIWTLLDMLFI